MLLPDSQIRALVACRQLGIEPYDAGMVQPASIDVRLDRFFRLFDSHRHAYIDPGEDQGEMTRLVDVPQGEAFVLHPGEFALASTYERVRVPENIAARVEGKSSLGRLGLLTHATAGFVDPGFEGHVTLELGNVASLPIRLWPGMKIGQLCFFALSGPVSAPYGSAVFGSRYQGQRGPTASLSHVRFQVTDVYGGDQVDG